MILRATIVLTVGMWGLGLASTALADDPNVQKPAGLRHEDVQKVQQSLIDKGYYHGSADGIMGPRTRAGIRQYQQSENLPVTGRLDGETAGKLGVGPESVGGEFKGAGQDVGAGGKEVGHEMKKGKPIAAGKELGKGFGRAGEKVGEGVKKAVTPESDRGDREKQKQ